MFPGGRVDPADLDGLAEPVSEETGSGAAGVGETTGELAAARRAAARETAEEAGLTIDGRALVPLARWCPPAAAARRFQTWILLGRAPEQDVTVDGGEIVEHRWMRPAAALQARDAGEIELLPPTWVTLWTLMSHGTVAAALAGGAATAPELFETEIAKAPGGLVAIWHGDADYRGAAPAGSERHDPESADRSGAAHTGGRHRLWMLSTGWRYERASF